MIFRRVRILLGRKVHRERCGCGCGVGRGEIGKQEGDLAGGYFRFRVHISRPDAGLAVCLYYFFTFSFLFGGERGGFVYWLSNWVGWEADLETQRYRHRHRNLNTG